MPAGLLRQKAEQQPLLPSHFPQPCSPSPPSGAAPSEASAAHRCPSGGGLSESASPRSCPNSAPGQTTAVRGGEGITTVYVHGTLYGPSVWTAALQGLEVRLDFLVSINETLFYTTGCNIQRSLEYVQCFYSCILSYMSPHVKCTVISVHKRR